jgi:hypothetical protein
MANFLFIHLQISDSRKYDISENMATGTNTNMHTLTPPRLLNDKSTNK